MAFKQPEEPVRSGGASQKSTSPKLVVPQPPKEPETKPAPGAAKSVLPDRVVAIDAFRGFTMLALASSGLAITGVVEKNPTILNQFADKKWGNFWSTGWQWAAAELQHSAWTGCTAWDLIQPSFMFLVGVAMPFSYASRAARGQSWFGQLGHVIVRSLVLILLGIFLRSIHSGMTNFTFEDVLTQIGLGYLFLFLLLRMPFWTQFVAGLVILGGYWFFFFQEPLPPQGGNLVTQYLAEVRHEPSSEWTQFTGLAAHWNKHTNAAAAADRTFLNLFPRPGQPWEGKKFWVNGGGYQTLNFVPSLVTMLFGVMAGRLLRGPRTPRAKFMRLFIGGALCFIIAMALDTTIWPVDVRNLHYTYCPTVKRIWTPTWTLFSGGWTLWFLAAFYWFVEMRGFRRLAFPLTVVGMNSIAVYCIYELLEGWLGTMLKIHLATLDAIAHTSLVHWLYDPDFLYAPIWRQCAILLLVWLICLWLYRRRIFIRI